MWKDRLPHAFLFLNLVKSHKSKREKMRNFNKTNEYKTHQIQFAVFNENDVILPHIRI